MKKVTKEDVQTVFKSLRDKEKVENIKQMFYVDSIKGACVKACQLYGFDKGFDLSLELVGFLLSRDMISCAEGLEIITDVTFVDYDEKEGDEHDKD